MNDVDEARLQAIVGALRAFRQEWSCDQVSASYVTPGGELHTLNVGRSFAFVEDENGEGSVVWSSWDA